MQQPKILVAIRKRPLSKKELSRGQNDTVSVKNSDTVIVSEYKQKVDLTKYLEETIFNFDFAFHEQTQNEEIYDQAVRPLVDSAFQGAKVTCFAYGQTGSGKTYTMNGDMSRGVYGLYTLGANDIFDYLASPQFRHLKAKLSFFEIYCGKLYDLLNKRTELKLREDNKNNINIIGMEQANVSSSEQFIEYLAQGGKERVTSQNSANADSSRSHAILQISLKDGKKLHGKISFIDLAGNERGADHMDMDKQTRIDGAEINKSLLSLKECIRALDQGKGHTPFRGSKLTMVLKDSFVGFCRTVMIGNVSPSSASSENTLNTLRYADRVKELRKPQEGGSREEQKAKELMLPRQNKNAIRIMISNEDDAEDIAKKREDAQKEYGIMEEQVGKRPGPVKEEISARKNSFNGGKMQPKEPLKSTSLAKNYNGNALNNGKQPMTNNLVGPPPQLPQAIKPVKSGPQQGLDSGRGEAPQGLRRYNSNQQGVYEFGKKEEPMEIQSPTGTPGYYLPGKNAPNNGKPLFAGRGAQQQGFVPQQGNNGFGGMNQSQNVSANYSNLSVGTNLSLSQMGAPNTYGQPSRGNYAYNQHQQQPPQQNAFYNNYNQGSKGNVPFQNNPNNNFPNNNGNFPSNNNPNNYNYQNYNQGNNPGNLFQNNRMQAPQQQYQLPENWQDLVTTVAGSDDPEFTERIVAEMNQRLFSQQQQLMRGHSDSLRRQIDIIKSEMGLLNEMQIDKGRITSRGYVQFMQESIEEKISLLEELRERLINFTYKLDAVEEIERGGARTGNIDDEQLLDDIN